MGPELPESEWSVDFQAEYPSSPMPTFTERIKQRAVSCSGERCSVIVLVVLQRVDYVIQPTSALGQLRSLMNTEKGMLQSTHGRYLYT